MVPQQRSTKTYRTNKKVEPNNANVANCSMFCLPISMFSSFGRASQLGGCNILFLNNSSLKLMINCDRKSR